MKNLKAKEDQLLKLEQQLSKEKEELLLREQKTLKKRRNTKIYSRLFKCNRTKP